MAYQDAGRGPSNPSGHWFRINLKVYERLIALCAALPMIYVEWRSDLIGFVLFAGLFGMIVLRERRAAVTEVPRGAPVSGGDDG